MLAPGKPRGPVCNRNAAVCAPLLAPQTPHFDMDLRLCDSPDIMALPGVPLLVQSGAALPLLCRCWCSQVWRCCRNAPAPLPWAAPVTAQLCPRSGTAALLVILPGSCSIQPLSPVCLCTAAISIVAGKMLVYPNEFMLPLMPNFGLPPPPQGMLHIKVGVPGLGLRWGLMWVGGDGVVLTSRRLAGGSRGMAGAAGVRRDVGTCKLTRLPASSPLPPTTLDPPTQSPPFLSPQVVKCTGLKGGIFDRMDPFVTLELRKGREAKVRKQGSTPSMLVPSSAMRL